MHVSTSAIDPWFDSVMQMCCIGHCSFTEQELGFYMSNEAHITHLSRSDAQPKSSFLRHRAGLVAR
jgi:hypothetical protein